MLLSLFHTFVKNATCLTKYSMTNSTFYCLQFAFIFTEKCTTLTYEDLPRGLGNKGTQSFISREQGIFNFAENGIDLLLKGLLYKNIKRE